MSYTLYDGFSPWMFLAVTVVMGGAAAWIVGRSVAVGWRPSWTLVVYLLFLACGIRFIHFALFGGNILSVSAFALDALVLLGIGCVGYRYCRSRKMVEQYDWLYERHGLMGWRERAAEPE